jgi:hypothetical protein
VRTTGTLVCEVCNGPRAPGDCTNNRCAGCHRLWCTPGGSTLPPLGPTEPPKDHRTYAQRTKLV